LSIARGFTLLLLFLLAGATLNLATPSAQATAVDAGEDQVRQCIYLFYDEGCEDCILANAFIANLQKNYSIDVHRFEVHNTSNWELMVKFFNHHNVTEYDVPAVFIGNEALIMLDEIEARLPSLLANNTGWMCPSYNSSIPPYTPASPPLLIIFGLAVADSLNPCAISVLLLLMVTISFSTRAIWKTGGAYILGNFIAYFLVGYGLLAILQSFNLPQYTSKVVAVAAIALSAYALVSRLPSQTRPFIKKVINSISSPLFAFPAGMIISLIELPCSGGPYFLAMTLISQYRVTQAELFGYLFVYNLIFVLPLLVVLSLYMFLNKPAIPKHLIRYASAVIMLVVGAILLVI